MIDWRKALVEPHMSVRETIERIDTSSLQAALVVDDQMRLLGMVTDGDVRRGILGGVSLEESVRRIMNVSPLTASRGSSRDELVGIMQRRHLRHLPIIDETSKLLDVVLLEDISENPALPNWVLLMAGGEGVRLRPLTEERPKPMLHVGPKPLLETILSSFISHGFHHFFMSVNYKADMITDHFGDGSKWGVEVRYLRETTKMGTAGCLSLLPGKPDEPFIVMNGDLLTNVNFKHLLEFHRQTKAMATVCVREHRVEIPYGVIETERHRLTGLREKPVEQYFINAGIYVLNPEALQFVPGQSYMDMTDLLETLLQRNVTISTFPIHEYWSDIGQIDDFYRAQTEVAAVFDDD